MSHTNPADQAGNPLELTGERTAPGHELEQYWFARHEVAYEWSSGLIRDAVGADGSTTPEALTIVDAGCGEGYGAALLAGALGANVIGLELDRSAAEHARARYGNAITVLEANLDEWPVANDTTDVVISMQVVEHLWNLPKFWAEAKRVLKPGGLMIITTPNRLTFSPSLGRGEKPTNPFHVEEFDMEQLAAMVGDAGFSDVTCNGLHHGTDLREWEEANGDLVALQVQASLASEAAGTQWPASLVTKVKSIKNSDFAINSDTLDSSADLVITARRPAND